MKRINQDDNSLINFLFKKNAILPEESNEVDVLPEDSHVDLINCVFRLFQSVRSASRYLSAKNIENVSIETISLLNLCNERKDNFGDDEKIVIYQGMDFLKQFLTNLESKIQNEQNHEIEIISRNLETCIKEIEKDLNLDMK